MYIEYMKNAQNLLDERLQILLDQETHQDLIAEANKKGLPKSTYIRVLLKEKFENDRNKK